jgi:hypothetical protein
MLYGSKLSDLSGGCPEFVSDLLPSVNGLFLGNDSRRWDGSKLLNLPGGKSIFGFGLTLIQCAGAPFDDQYCSLVGGLQGSTSNTPDAFKTPIVAGKFTKLKVRVTDLNDFTIDIPVAIRVNGVDSAAMVTIGAGATNMTYTWSGEVTISEDDLVDLHFDVADAGGSELAYVTFSYEFQPS